MKAVKVTYTVNPGSLKENIANIKAFLKEVKKIGDPDMQYFVFLDEDGKTFTHLSFYKNDEAQKRFLALPIFQYFQQQRDENRLEKEPSITSLNIVDASHIIFQ